MKEVFSFLNLNSDDGVYPALLELCQTIDLNDFFTWFGVPINLLNFKIVYIIFILKSVVAALNEFTICVPHCFLRDIIVIFVVI